MGKVSDRFGGSGRSKVEGKGQLCNYRCNYRT